MGEVRDVNREKEESACRQVGRGTGQPQKKSNLKKVSSE